MGTRFARFITQKIAETHHLCPGDSLLIQSIQHEKTEIPAISFGFLYHRSTQVRLNSKGEYSDLTRFRAFARISYSAAFPEALRFQWHFGFSLISRLLRYSADGVPRRSAF